MLGPLRQLFLAFESKIFSNQFFSEQFFSQCNYQISSFIIIKDCMGSLIFQAWSHILCFMHTEGMQEGDIYYWMRQDLGFLLFVGFILFSTQHGIGIFFCDCFCTSYGFVFLLACKVHWLIFSFLSLNTQPIMYLHQEHPN